MSRVKWLGARDKPTKTFFTFVKVKNQRESMNLLIIKDGSIIKDEDGILQEVARFYCHLF